MNSRYLILQDGTYYKGIPFGAKSLTFNEIISLDNISSCAAELVFNTSMCSYTEVLSDNSYAGQMVVMTTPHIGTVGCDPSWFQHLTHTPQLRVLIAKKVYHGPLLNERLSLHQTCENFSIQGLESIDTAAVAKAMGDVFAGRKTELTPQESEAFLKEHFNNQTFLLYLGLTEKQRP